MRSKPDVTVHYKPAILRPGDELTVDLDMVSHGSTPVSRIAITLTGQEKVLEGGESGETYPPTTLVSLAAEFPATTLGTGTHTRSAVFRIPEKAPPTVHAAGVLPRHDLATDYEVAVEVEIPWWPDLRKVFVLVVDPPTPSAAPVPSRRSAEVFLWAGEAPTFDVWLDSAALRRGETLSGHLLFPRFPEGEKVDVQVTFVASGRGHGLGISSPHDFVRYESRALVKAPSSGSVVDFNVVLPAEAPPSYEGFVMKIAWRADITVRRHRREATGASTPTVTTFPIEVFGGEGGAGVSRGFKADIAHLGAERRLLLWAQVAEKMGLIHDLEADRLRWTAGAEVNVEVLVEDGPTGTFTVAKLAWPPLGMELRVAPRRLSDVLRGGVETEDDAFDRLYHVEARERSQALAVLGHPVRRVLARFEDEGVTVDDEGARLAVGGNGRDEQALVQLVKRAKALAEGLAKGLGQVPMPAVLARWEAAWRGVAARLGGRFAPGGPWIREGKWNEATVEIGIVWDPGGVIRGTVLRMVLDPPLGGAVDPRSPEARLSRPALARVNALAGKVGEAVFGPSVLEVTLAAVTLDPEDALSLFEEMAAVAAALQGRLEGPYR